MTRRIFVKTPLTAAVMLALMKSAPCPNCVHAFAAAKLGVCAGCAKKMRGRK